MTASQKAMKTKGYNQPKRYIESHGGYIDYKDHASQKSYKWLCKLSRLYKL